jgi:pimeloyl-ACP methyl ester carboxylesterase
VSRLVLLCPSGLHGDENLPLMEGVRRSRYDTLVKSVFHRGHYATEELVDAIGQKFQDRKWKKGRRADPAGHRGPLRRRQAGAGPPPVPADLGADDRVIADVPGSIRAAGRLLRGRQVVIPKCGHAPQIEKARLVNQLVHRFLRDTLKTIPPQLDPARFLRAGMNRLERAAHSRH